MAQNTINIKPPQVKRQFNSKEYILTKIDYTKQDAEEDQAYHNKRGRDARIVNEDGFWLVYTKIEK